MQSPAEHETYSQLNFQPARSWEDSASWQYYNQFVVGGDYSIYPTPPESQGPGVADRSTAYSGLTKTPTPMLPHSPSLAPVPEHEGLTNNEMISVSTAFCPGAHSIGSDLVFSSSDGVLFYVHSKTMVSTSRNAFASVASSPLSTPTLKNKVIQIPETSVVLNIILHMLYGTSSAQHGPSFDDLSTAIDRMPEYDILPKAHIVPQTPLYTLLLSHAPLQPMKVYALAAYHELSDLAVQSTSHLLAFPLGTLSDDLAKRMGPVYLKRLFLLHIDRLAALKDILLHPPHPHPVLKDCNFEDQKKITRAWALVSAYLAWDAKPDISTHRIQGVFNPLTDNITCHECHESLKKQVRNVIVKWASIKCTI